MQFPVDRKNERLFLKEAPYQASHDVSDNINYVILSEFPAAILLQFGKIGVKLLGICTGPFTRPAVGGADSQALL
jgi:hypothetical protein